MLTMSLRILTIALVWQSVFCLQAHASKLQPAAPHTAILSPSGGFVEVEDRAVVCRQDGASIVRFVLPAGAENLRLTVPGQTVARWSSSACVLDTVSPQRQELQAERDRLGGLLAAVIAQRDIWQTVQVKSSLEEQENYAAKARESLPELVWEQAVLERRIKQVDAVLKSLPVEQGQGRLVSVVLQSAVPEGHELRLHYSYTLSDCGWRPVYELDARPDSADASIDVRLMAEVWQNSGLDWPEAKIRLSTQSVGPREPRPLPVWKIASRPEPRRDRASGNAPMVKGDMASSGSLLKAVPADAAVTVDTSSVYALWEPAARGLSQGHSRSVMRESSWQAPLQWLARPGSEGKSPVWLTAEYTIPAGEVWPEGRARYSVDGQYVGQGTFQSVGGKATLFFGADPRVSVIVTEDSQKRGESGFIDKKRVWSWAWTYTVKNGHQRPLTVKLERPAPRIVDADVSLSYKDDPEPRRDQKTHQLIWDVAVPAGGSADVRHGLSITAPMDLWIVAP